MDQGTKKAFNDLTLASLCAQPYLALPDVTKPLFVDRSQGIPKAVLTRSWGPGNNQWSIEEIGRCGR